MRPLTLAAIIPTLFHEISDQDNSNKVFKVYKKNCVVPHEIFQITKYE